MRIVKINSRTNVSPKGSMFLLGRKVVPIDIDTICKENDPQCYEFASMRVTNKKVLMSKRRLENTLDVFVAQQSLLAFHNPVKAKSFINELQRRGHTSFPQLDVLNYDQHNGSVELTLTRRNLKTDNLDNMLALKVQEDEIAELCFDLYHNIFTIDNQKWLDNDRINLNGNMEHYVFKIEDIRERLGELLGYTDEEDYDADDEDYFIEDIDYDIDE